MGKPVWKLSCMPFELKDTGIIIGINPTIWNDILFSLNQCKAENYLCPFLFDFK